MIVIIILIVIAKGPRTMTVQFDREKLDVYQKALAFIRWLEPIQSSISGRVSAKDQIDRASTSIPLNIAEGNGRFTSKDRCRFFDIARGSALECAACLDVFAAKGMLENGRISKGKEMLAAIVSMLVGLIRSNSRDRVYEESAPYGAETIAQFDYE